MGNGWVQSVCNSISLLLFHAFPFSTVGLSMGCRGICSGMSFNDAGVHGAVSYNFCLLFFCLCSVFYSLWSVFFSEVPASSLPGSAVSVGSGHWTHRNHPYKLPCYQNPAIYTQHSWVRGWWYVIRDETSRSDHWTRHALRDFHHPRAPFTWRLFLTQK